MGLQWFLASRRSPYLPTMIAGLLDSFATLLDPALARPDPTAELTRNTRYLVRDIRPPFSRSVTECLEPARQSRLFTAPDVDTCIIGRTEIKDSVGHRVNIYR